MALTVTAGSAAADSFVSVADCEAYCAAHGLTRWTSAADSPPDLKEAALRRATAYLSDSFTWKGARTSGRAQALAWPRIDVTDGEGEEIASDEIPVEIVNATCIIASYEVETPGYMSPAVIAADRIKSERIGPMAVEYMANSAAPEASRPVILQINDMVGGLVLAGTNSLVGSSVRI